MEDLKEHWLKEIEIRDLLSGDLALIYDFCGRGVLIRLWEEMTGLNLYISAKSLHAARARYIALHYDGHNLKRLAVKLGCSEKFVHDVLNRKTGDFMPKKGADSGPDTRKP